jgi:uncharacterized protein YndB with AHSA1/START domain
LIDIDHHISERRRQVGRRVLGAGEVRSVTITTAYPTDLEDLWDACTNPERLPRWFLPVSGELREGGRYQLEGNAGGTIERCDPPHSFTATWEFGEQVSWIELRLTQTSPEETELELEHIVPVDAHWEQFGPGAVGIGWDLGLTGLHLHIASGEPVDPAEFMAWSASEDGRRFAVACSEGWQAANVLSGADEADARAQAERTTAAYTEG